MRLVPTRHLLFFASPKKSKQKKGTPTCRFGCAKLLLLRILIFGACELVALRAPSDNARLFPKKECCVRLDVGEMQ